MNRYNPVHGDAMVADDNGTHVRYSDHAAALTAERARVIRLPHTHGDVILAATPDGREFVCAMEVDRLLKESEDRVLSDLAFRLGIDIERLPGTDGITCDSGGGGYDGARPVPMYASLEVRRLRKQAAEDAAGGEEVSVNTNIITATEVEAKPVPRRWVRVWDTARPGGNYTTSVACTERLAPDAGESRVYMLPSTADAERAKERERLVSERDAALKAFLDLPDHMAVVSRQGPAMRRLIYTQEALAAFDAANGIGGAP